MARDRRRGGRAPRDDGDSLGRKAALGGVKYRFHATERFWENFYRLPPSQKESVRQAWRIFRQNPFDPRLGVRKIQRLSAIMRQTVYAVAIEGDLRAVFYLDGNQVVTFNVGAHEIYKR